MKLKAITLYQPWATLIAVGAKTIETRSWSTPYRGRIAIHAGARKPETARLGDWWCEPTWGVVYGLLDEAGYPSPLPLRAIVATAALVDVVPIGPTDDAPLFVDFSNAGDELFLWERHPELLGNAERNVTDQIPFGDFTPGRYAWLLDDVVAVDPPVPANGRQRLWTWKGDLP